MSETLSGLDRNIRAVTTLFDGYRHAWRDRKIPKPERGLLVWAEGAVAEVGGQIMHVSPHDVADDPFFLQIEAEYYWAAIPDWRVTGLDVAGTGNVVLSQARFEGTGPDGEVLAPLWLADRWQFDDQGRITRWTQVTDLVGWMRWGALNRTTDYVTHVTRAFAAVGAMPRFVP